MLSLRYQNEIFQGGVNILILLVMVFLIITIFEVPGMIQKKYWKELITFGILLFFGFCLSLLMVLGIALPNVTSLITQLFQSILHIKG
jgi:hypothetical protein